MSVDEFWTKTTLSLQQWTGYENNDFLFAVFWDTTAWEVYRYDRLNNLTRTTSSWTWTVPNDLTTLIWLTYS